MEAELISFVFGMKLIGGGESKTWAVSELQSVICITERSR